MNSYDEIRVTPARSFFPENPDDYVLVLDREILGQVRQTEEGFIMDPDSGSGQLRDLLVRDDFNAWLLTKIKD